ncbi:hypothetical protein FQR65_LT00865 [Abscondita terminalis]|nr:hypothetical protein FQR65_LT00865 [Abscondita terminalis]
MKFLALLSLAIAAATAQVFPDIEIVQPLPCCLSSQLKTSLGDLISSIVTRPNCDPLFVCISRCLNLSIGTGIICAPNTRLHVTFNLWLLNNYHCLPNSLLQCLKGCIQYNSNPPCNG